VIDHKKNPRLVRGFFLPAIQLKTVGAVEERWQSAAAFIKHKISD
jgi:hypothetical protein